MKNDSLPIEIGLDKAKREILQAVNQIGYSYEIPSSFIVLILQQIVYESKINTYETIMANYNIDIPDAVKCMNIDQASTLEKDAEMIDKSVSEESSND